MKIKKIRIIHFAIIIIFVLISIPVTKKVKLNLQVKKVQDAFYKENSKLDINDLSFKSISLLDGDLENNQIFLTGESHGTKASYELKEYFTRYFVEKAGVKYIIYEGGFCTAQLINEYLKTGDMEIINYIMSNLRGTQSYTKNHYESIKNLYKYNQSLPEDRKLQLVGIDIEHQPLIARRYITSLLPKDEAPSELKEMIEHVKKISRNNYQNNCKEIIKILENNQESAKEYLGNNYGNFLFGVKNLSISSGQLVREKYMINNFIEQYEKLPKGKYFGQLGGFHVSQSGVEDKDGYIPFAGYLQNNYKGTEGKVLSISFEYENSNCYSPIGNEEYYIKNSFVNYTDAVYTTDIFPKDKKTTLFKLNYEGSMFLDKYNLCPYPYAKIYQYVVTISDSPSGEKYE